MNKVYILLLEDDEIIAKTFIKNFSNELVSVKVVKNVPELFHELANADFDTVIIDPMMSATLDFPRLVEELSKKDTEIKIAYPNQFLSPHFERYAREKDIETVSLKDTNQLYEIIQALVKKKSNGTQELREIDRQLEIRIIKTEVHLDHLLKQVTKQFEEIRALQQKLTEHSNSLIEIKNAQTYMIDTMHRLDQNLGTVATVLDGVDPEKDRNLQLSLKDKEEATKRFITLVGVFTAVITTLGAVSIPFSNVVIEWVKIHSPTRNK